LLTCGPPQLGIFTQTFEKGVREENGKRRERGGREWKRREVRRG